MIKEAINRILELAVPNTVECNGRTYVDKNMTELSGLHYAKPLEVHTLSAVVDYISHKVDYMVLDDGKFVLHVEDYNRVCLYRELDGDKRREQLLTATVSNCKYPFGHWMEMETFIINLQTAFVSDENIMGLLSIAGNIISESGVAQEDDGVSQRVTVKSGISVVSNKTVPNPVYLRPYRTFTEIEQPESAFVFRVRKNQNEMTNAALFESDGEEWKRSAILGIADWFKEAFQEQADVIILA